MKNLVIISILLMPFCSCSRQNNSNKRNENLVFRYFEYFNQHNWQAMAGMYADTAEFKDPSLGQGIVRQTRKQIIAKYTELSQIFPDLTDKVIKLYPSGPKNIIVEFISTGTAADGSKFHLPICTIFTIENNLITQDFTYYDNFEE